MKVKLVAVLDSASGVYDGPAPVINEMLAMRNFTDMCTKNEKIKDHPGDFSLWLLGEYNDSTGEITTCAKKCLGYAVDLMNPNNEES